MSTSLCFVLRVETTDIYDDRARGRSHLVASRSEHAVTHVVKHGVHPTHAQT